MCRFRPNSFHVNDELMKRREFLNVTVGATIIMPWVTTAKGQPIAPISPLPDLTPKPAPEKEGNGS